MNDITYWKNPITGLIEGIRADGEVEILQKDPMKLFDAKAPNGFEERERENGEKYWVAEDLPLRKIRSYAYNPAIGGAIASEVANGGYITTLWKKHEWCPPYSILARWLRLIPEFREMIDQATRDRAELHFEETISLADEAYENAHPDDKLAAAKLQIESRKWVAEKANKEKFGNNNKLQVEGAVQIVVHTGIVRDVTAKPEQITVETKLLEDKKDGEDKGS